MKRLLFNNWEGKDFCRNNDKERYHESTPKSGNDSDCSAKGRDRVHITVAHSGHCNHSAPNRGKVFVKVFLPDRVVILNLEYSQLVGQNDYWADEKDDDSLGGIGPQQCLESETNIGCKAIAFAELFRKAFHVLDVVEAGADYEVGAEEHCHKDEIA